MSNILIVSAPSAWPSLQALLGPGAAPVCAATGGEARRQALLAAPQLAVINTPLPDEFGRELALQLAAAGADVMLLAAAAQADKIAAGMEKQGVYVLPKPISRQSAAFALRVIRTARARTEQLRRQNQKLTRRLEEMRLISRAKCALVRYCDMTEPEAHRVLEQRAMDERLPIREVALDVLKTYEGI